MNYSQNHITKILKTDSQLKIKNFSIGVDIENIDRFQKINLSKNNSFLKKVYTEKELKYCLSKKFPARHLAALFCGKEAVYKTLKGESIGSGLAFNKIEITHQKSGAPVAKIKDNKFGKIDILISLSHCENTAVAVAIIFKKI